MPKYCKARVFRHGQQEYRIPKKAPLKYLEKTFANKLTR